MQSLPAPLKALALFPQFIAYNLVDDPAKPGKKQKKPVNPHTGYVASPTDPSNWGTFEQCVGKGDGVGFVLTENDPFFFLDLDNCAEGADWSLMAKEVLRLVPGCAVEVSQSGTGLHVLGMYGGKAPEHSCKNTELDFEFYTEGRFVALTGSGAVGCASTVCHTLPQIVAAYFPPAISTPGAQGWTTGPSEDWDGHTTDLELLAHAFSVTGAAGAFGAKATFKQLWEADTDALAAAFPDVHGGRAYDASSADAALAQHLAFWTGRDCERMLRLMKDSGLVREKWERDDYLARTITGATARCSQVHKKKRADATPPEVATESRVTAPGGLLTGEDQLEYFKGCVYILDMHRVLTPRGAILKPDQFRVAYGGKSYMMDAEGRRVSRNAWEAFTESQVATHPQAERTMFRPDLPPGEVFDYDGITCVNSFIPAKNRGKRGDVSPFLNHLARLLPDPKDRAIVLAYMAACVQHIGVKFQWCILLQGVEGNGKTLLSRVVAEALGMRYVHCPRATEIAGKFNSWMKDKLFIYVEDVYLPDSKREVLEALKPIITNNWQPVELKGVDQSTEYVVANLMLNSNHRDAIRKTKNDRRFAVFYTAQQEFEDLERDGMGGQYFRELYQWLKVEGFEAVAEHLASYPIPDELNPATGCQRAPVTSSQDAVLAESLGAVEQEIMEAIEEGHTGFKGGFISSIALDTLLKNIRADRKIPQNKRPQLLAALGYVKHPALRDGRVNDPVLPDGGKPRLYIKEGHILTNLTKASEVAKHYTEAQNFNGPDAAAAFAS